MDYKVAQMGQLVARTGQKVFEMGIKPLVDKEFQPMNVFESRHSKFGL
jgi:hypothetical protein